MRFRNKTNRRMTIFFLFVLVCILVIPSALSMYRETQTKPLKVTIVHPNYTVTADANGGNIPTTTGWTGTGLTATKQVTYGHEYGNLPTPTRNGYTFKGWNGKNLFNKDATDANTGTYIKGDGTIISYGGYTLYQISIKPNTTYTITNSGRSVTPGYVIFNESGTRVAGESYASRATITFTTPSTASYIKLSVVTDNTGTDAYRYDKDSFQLEESSSATTYEPYYVTSSVNVTQSKDHILKAIWEAVNYEITYDLQGGNLSTANPATYNAETDTFTLNNPTLEGYTFIGWTGSNGNTPETTVTIPKGSTGDKAYIANWRDLEAPTLNLRKVTYKTNDFSDWTLSNASIDSNGVLTMGADGNPGVAQSDFIDVNGDFYYNVFDGYSETAIPNSSNGGIFWAINYYDSNYQPTTGLDNKTGNGHAVTIALNTWKNNIYWLNSQNDIDLWKDRGQYGENVKYVKIRYSSNDTYGPPPIKIRNLKIYGESMFNSFYLINVTSNDNVGIVETKYASGNQDVSYFATGGTTISNNQIRVTENGVYTVYVRDAAGNATVKTIEITNIKKEATFLPGKQFNAKIKQLAGDIDATHTTRDTNITTIMRYPGTPSQSILNNADIVSTSDSIVPIYAWYENGTLYYYSETEHLYMNSDASSMFYELKNVTAIDVSTINTSRTVNMRNLFDRCNNLEIMDLSNFDTSSVTNMAWMFASNYKFQTINLSNFNTSNVTNMDGMFGYMSALLQLDLSNFDMSSVTTINNFFYNTPKLESLKTPKVYPTDTSVTITLPQTLYSVNGMGYTALDSTSPTETWLYKGYEIMYDLQGGVLYNITNPTTYNIETDTFTLNNPTQVGYTFLGWTGSNGNTPQTTVTIPKGSTGDKAYIANWQVNNYNLTLNANGGTIGSNKLFSFDGSTHTIDGTIVGATWGDDYLQFAGDNTTYVNLGEINSDYMTLQATFSVDEPVTNTQVIIGNVEVGGGCIVIQKTDGKFIIMGEYYINDGYKVVYSDVVPEVGKKYNVMLTYDGETEKLYINNALIDSIEAQGTIKTPVNNTIMALGANPSRSGVNNNYFKGKIYNASVYSNPKKQVTYGQTYNDLPTPIRDGYTFKGWYTDLSGTSDYVNYGREYMYQDKISIHTSAYMDNWSTFGNKTIFSSTQSGGLSLFSSNGYVTYSVYDNGVGYKRVISTTKWADLSKGWHDFDLVFDGEYIYGYIDGSSVGTSEKFASGKIKYHTTNSMFFGDEATASPTTPSGSNFVGNIGNTIIKNNSNLISGTTYNTITAPAQDLILYAIWEPINYEIMYDLQGGVLYNTTNPTTYNPDTNTITLNNPTKIGYTFLGWTGSNGNTPETTVTIPTGSTGDKTYIANWQVNNYTLTFDANGGNVSTTTKSVQYGQTYNDLPTPTRFGYTFRGWYKTFDGTNDYINMGREYMYGDKISIHTSAYMDDWSTFTSVIFSSLQTGGWGILPLSDNFRFSCYDSEVGYKHVNTSTALASLSSGWHDFDLVFDGEYAYGYVDGQLSGKSAKFTSGNIGYNPTNSIFIGGEATNSPTEPNTYRFNGNLGNIIIKNSDKLISRTTYNTITAPAQDLTLYAKWDSNATFLPGSEFNAKIKQLAGNSNATYATTDTNITTIVRYPGIPTSTMLSNAEIVSTTDSTTPIYAWFDNGVIYYYTESEYPYMNSDASNMFYELSNVIAIDVSTIDTSRTTNMSGVFYNDNKLKTLDLSNFDMSGVTSTTDMLSSMTSLESLKTPSIYPTNTSVNITLPSTLYTQDGTGYSTLNSTSPIDTWLYKMICKRATTLHTEQCSQTSKTLYCSASGYQVGGSKNTTTITYGNFGTDNTSLNGGDAFTCDVNGDGIYNEETERFYYVSDYYNTQTKSFETDTGVLVYYNNVSAGVPNNTGIFTYDDTDNLHGPRSATQQLPTTTQWSNVSLKNTERAILNYQNGNTADSEQLPSNYSYLGHSARLLTQQEINSSVGKAITSFGKNQTDGLDLLAPHYFENTKYSNNNLISGSWWLEGTTVAATTHALRIMTTPSTQYGNGIYSISVGSSIGVRPAIEVNKNFLNKKVYSYLITYDTNGGSENTTQTISVGNSLSTLPTNPTRRGYSFDGWYTAKTGGTQITTSTVPTTNTTYYAHWTPNTYTLTFNANGGNVSTTTKSVEYGTTYNDLPTPTRAGYTFKGWYQIYNQANHDYTSYGRDYMYKDKISIHASAYMDDWSNVKTLLSSTEVGGWSINNNNGNITFYIYDENVGYKTKESSVSWASLSPGWHDFDLVFDGEYAYGYLDGTKITTSDKFTSGSIGYHGFNQILIGAETLADGSPVLSECFNGNIGNVVIKNDDTLIPSTTYNTITAPAQNATLYAKWEPVNYEITYDLQGGTLSTANPTTYNAETETFTLNNPTKEGYEFIGWTGSNGNTPETTVTIPKGSTGDKTYIANWKEIYTITYDANDGYFGYPVTTSPTTTNKVTYTKDGNTVTAYADGVKYREYKKPIRDGYRFDGWSTSKTATTPTYTDEDTAKAIVQTTGSATLYAVWTRVWAENLSYDNTKTGVNCSDAQCMLDYLATRLTNKGTTKFKVGDLVRMTPQNSSYTTETKYTGYSSTQTINPKELNLWRVIRVNSNGTVDVVSEYVSSIDLYFQGTIGYQNFSGYLNKIASQYENPRYTVGSRYMGYNGQTEFITDTSYFDGTSAKAVEEWTSSTSGTPAEEYLGRGDMLLRTDLGLVKAAYGGASDSAKANKVGTTTAVTYWQDSRYYYWTSSTKFNFCGFGVSATGGTPANCVRSYNNSSWEDIHGAYNLRPIITLRPGLTARGSGTSSDPYVLN